MKSSPKPTAMASACTASASASARRPAPSARAIAAEIPPPMAPADIICISISAGKTRATPASASVPSLPTKYVSMRPTEACMSMTSTFGVASRRSVLVIGPSSRTRVLGSNRCAVAAGGASSGRDPTSARTPLPFDITASVLRAWASMDCSFLPGEWLSLLLKPALPSAGESVVSLIRMADEPLGTRRLSDGSVSGRRASGLAERQLRSVPRSPADGRLPIPPDPSTASRMLGASVSRGVEGRVRRATEHDAGDAAAGRPPRDGGVPGEQAERAAILRQHVGAELMDAALLSRTKDFLEEERAEAESLRAVRHDEADVGRGPLIRTAEPRHPGQLGLLPGCALLGPRRNAACSRTAWWPGSLRVRGRMRELLQC